MAHNEPVINAPPVVVATLGVFAAVHAARLLLGDEESARLLLSLAFIPARYGPHLMELPGGKLAAVTSFLTYMLVHGDAVHLLINSAWLLAIGSPVARRLGGPRFLLFGVACGVTGALTFLVLNFGLLMPMVGASGAISGLMGGLMRFLFAALDRGGPALLQEGARHVPSMPLAEMLRDRRAVLTIGVFLLLNVLLAVGIGGPTLDGAIAWEAHVGGFLTGLVVFGAFDRKSADGRGNGAPHA